MTEKWRAVCLSEPSNPYSDLVCISVDSGEKMVIDMLVDGTFTSNTKSKDLVGKTIICDYTIPCTLIAMNPRIATE